MSELLPNDNRLLDLAEAVCDKVASGDELAELDSVLLGDEASRRRYLRYLRMHVALKLDMLANDAAQKVCKRIDIEPRTPAPSEFDVTQGDDAPSGMPSSFFGTSLHGVVGHIPESLPFAYLVATVLVGLGLFIGSLICVSRPDQIAKDSVQSATPAVFEPQTVFVGRITGMVDCRWADPEMAVVSYAAVPLGRRYSLTSGLMEITYNTGARVILQGPCTYEVESRDSGYLSVGKLTARVEKTEERRTKNEELSASRSSFLIPHSYFAVRTPTATVTDLGTEFGVQVLEDGQTELHVLQGSVEARHGTRSGGERRVTLTAGQAVRMGLNTLAIERSNANASIFVRTIARPPEAQPTLMVADSFAYPDGPLAGNNGGSAGVGSFWSGAWFRGGSVIGGQVALPDSKVVSRLLHPVVAGSATRPIYFSARFTKTGNNPKYVSCLQLVANSDDTNDNYDDAMIGLTSDRYRVTLSEAATRRVRYEDYGDYTPGHQVLIVGKLEFNVDGANERLQAWINPTGEEIADVVSPQIMMDLGWTSPRCVHLRNWTGPTGTCFVSDVRIGYTWDAVAGPNNTSTSKEDLPMEK